MKKMKLSRDVLEANRGNLGLETDDSSRDKAILSSEPIWIVRRYFGWKLGDQHLADQAINVIEQAYGIKIACSSPAPELESR